MRVLTSPYRIAAGSPYMLPFCEVALLGRGRIPVQALIDSGAVFSVFPLRAAEDAEIDLPASPNHTTNYGGSSALGWRQVVDLELQGHRLRLSVVFVEHLALPYALLGRVGVFASYNEVAFLEKSHPPRVELRW